MFGYYSSDKNICPSLLREKVKIKIYIYCRIAGCIVYKFDCFAKFFLFFKSLFKKNLAHFIIVYNHKFAYSNFFNSQTEIKL